MTDRQRLLAIVAGALAASMVLYYVYSTWSGELVRLDREIAKEKKAVAELEKVVDQGEAALALLARQRERSLPGNLDEARAAYHAWLVRQAQAVGLIDTNVTPSSGREQAGVYYQFSFTLSGRGNIRQLTELLHAFYSVDLLHRIKRLNVKPIKNSKDLDLVIAIDGLTLFGATAESLREEPSQRLKRPSLEAYENAIVARNLFGPPNNAPKLTRIGPQRVVRGETMTVTLRGADDDPLDKLVYSVDVEKLPGAQFTAGTGRLTWRPTATGVYSFQANVTDDGFPRKTTSETVTVTVADPPPPPPRTTPMVVRTTPPPPQPPQPKLDLGKFTFVTAVTEVTGRTEVWLSVRTTGELLRLSRGERFNVQGLEGVVDAISDTDLEFTHVGRRYKVRLGDSLSQAVDASSGE